MPKKNEIYYRFSDSSKKRISRHENAVEGILDYFENEFLFDRAVQSLMKSKGLKVRWIAEMCIETVRET